MYCINLAGYFKKPKETEKTVDSDGWLHTGDVGFIDDDDDVFVVDRIKELIKYKGFQVYRLTAAGIEMKKENSSVECNI